MTTPIKGEFEYGIWNKFDWEPSSISNTYRTQSNIKWIYDTIMYATKKGKKKKTMVKCTYLNNETDKWMVDFFYG